jgi:hypothetical protein
MKISKRFLRMAAIYKIFAMGAEKLDFSDAAREEMFVAETYGKFVSESNGFANGKKWMDVNLSMWKQDIRDGLLRKKELYEDPMFPDWWLNRVL